MRKPVGFNTMMSRITKLFCTAMPIAREMSAKGVCVWNPDGQSFTLTWQRIHGRVIKLNNFRHDIISEADQLKQSFTALAPYLDFSSVALSQLVDDAESPISLFDRDDNRRLFEPFIQQIWLHLGRHQGTTRERPPLSLFSQSGVLNKRRAWSWLIEQEKFLLLFVAHFYRTVGIPPRAWQTSHLLYRQLGGYLRNVRMIHHGTVLISNPKAKQKDRLMYDAFWALPAHLRSHPHDLPRCISPGRGGTPAIVGCQHSRTSALYFRRQFPSICSFCCVLLFDDQQCPSKSCTRARI